MLRAMGILDPKFRTPGMALTSLSLGLLLACSESVSQVGGTGGTAAGGAPGAGGVAASGGAASGGALSGGAPSSGGSASGGEPSAGGSEAGGAMAADGGVQNTGGQATGGTNGDGGAPTGGVSGDGGSASGGAPPACPPAEPLTGGQQYCSNSKGNVGNGYGYELWAEGSGTGCMRVHGVDATFSAEWNDVEDFLARVGLDYNQTQKHTQIGDIKLEFAETKEESGGGLTYIGVYGWTVNPLREFYILDDWGEEKPGGFSSDGTPRDEVGTIEVDGETYDVWKKTRENKPSIIGNATFDQYFSIRRTARQCGTISVSEHFRKWEQLGLQLGNFHEVKLLLESQFNSGNIKVTKAKFTVD